jgi:hypothetical protein
MNISSAGAASIARTQQPAASSEAAEVKGAPDHDGDADDAAPAVQAKAALPPNVGQAVDKTA